MNGKFSYASSISESSRNKVFLLIIPDVIRKLCYFKILAKLMEPAVENAYQDSNLGPQRNVRISSSLYHASRFLKAYSSTRLSVFKHKESASELKMPSNFNKKHLRF